MCNLYPKLFSEVIVRIYTLKMWYDTQSCIISFFRLRQVVFVRQCYLFNTEL